MSPELDRGSVHSTGSEVVLAAVVPSQSSFLVELSFGTELPRGPQPAQQRLLILLTLTKTTCDLFFLDPHPPPWCLNRGESTTPPLPWGEDRKPKLRCPNFCLSCVASTYFTSNRLDWNSFFVNCCPKQSQIRPGEIEKHRQLAGTSGDLTRPQTPLLPIFKENSPPNQ